MMCICFSYPLKLLHNGLVSSLRSITLGGRGWFSFVCLFWEIFLYIFTNILGLLFNSPIFLRNFKSSPKFYYKDTFYSGRSIFCFLTCLKFSRDSVTFIFLILYKIYLKFYVFSLIFRCKLRYFSSEL